MSLARKMESERPRVYDYVDYRLFLKHYLDYLRQAETATTFRSLSRHLGFKSPSFIKHVIDGDRNLSPKSVVKIADGIGLSEFETQFFQNLVKFNQSDSLLDEKRPALGLADDIQGSDNVDPVEYLSELDRLVSSFRFALRPDCFEELRALVEEFHNSLVERIHHLQDDQAHEEVYQLSLQLMPLTRKK